VRVSRAVVTGIGCVGPAGADVASLQAALRSRKPLGAPETIESTGRRRREITVARLAPVERGRFIPAGKLRRMGEVSQVWTIACLLARADAGLDHDGIHHEPDTRGTYLGTGYGCIDTTWDFLAGLIREGAATASPFLFSESVANAPAGHSAIELDTRGAAVSFTCGDASATIAVGAAVRAIREDRVRMAYCGGIELLPAPLLRVLAGLGCSSVGEGCVCLILESFDAARRRGARIYAEIVGAGSASDPGTSATEWSRDARAHKESMRRAIEHAGGGARGVFLHACGDVAADAAEREAVEAVLPAAETRETTSIFGTLAAAGGFNLAAAVLEAPSTGSVLLNASSWGGSVASLLLESRA
jgi:3-oxoacyl-[acyl-carrier-protein] synthase II